MAETERIILGSGNVHMKLFDWNLPSVDEICTDENQISYIQGGATIEYKPSYYTAKDDTRKIQKTVITDEEATMKSGLMTFCGNTLEKICDTARVSYAEKTSTKKEKKNRKGRRRKQSGQKKICNLFPSRRSGGRRYLGNDCRKQSGRFFPCVRK